MTPADLSQTRDLASLVRRRSEPLAPIGDEAFAAAFDVFADAKVVLLGECIEGVDPMSGHEFLPDRPTYTAVRAAALRQINVIGPALAARSPTVAPPMTPQGPEHAAPASGQQADPDRERQVREGRFAEAEEIGDQRQVESAEEDKRETGGDAPEQASMWTEQADPGGGGVGQRQGQIGDRQRSVGRAAGRGLPGQRQEAEVEPEDRGEDHQTLAEAGRDLADAEQARS